MKPVLTLFLLVSLYSVAVENKNNIVEIKPPERKIGIEALFKENDYRMVKISPDGKHIALIRNHNDVPVIVIVDSKTMKAVNEIYFAKKDTVGRYSWGNNERLLISISSKKRNHEQKVNYGEIYSININEDEGKFVFGVRSLVHRGKVKRNVTEADYEKHLAHPRIINLLEDDPRHIIISTSQYEGEGMWVFKLDIYKGTLETIAKVDGHRIDHDSTKLWYLNTGQDLWLRTEKSNNDITIASYDFSNSAWVEHPIINATINFSIIGYYKGSNQLLVKDYCGNNTLSICLFDPNTQQLSSLYKIDGVDVGNLYIDNKNSPVAMSYFNEYPQYKILDETHTLAKELTKLLKRFTGYKVNVNWAREMNGKAIITLTSDVQPWVWYLFERSNNKLSFVANSRKEVDVSELLPQYSFKFEARDMTPVQGYITLPKSQSNAPKPAVILVHGGPHLRDEWGYDPEVQLLALSGYAVVQVNYRGSKGFGWKFESSGFKQWGQNMQYDIIDGVNHLAEKGYIDKSRLCIMGASFGGYSALQSSILAPELFKCAIASSGVYDLELLVNDNEYKEAQYLVHRVGSKKVQNLHSPVNVIEKLQAPLLLAHGTKDERTPFEQAEVLIRQLDKHNKPYEWIEYENEGHGLFNNDNQYNFYENVLSFLNKNNPVAN